MLVESDLELASSMLFFVLFLACWNDEVIHDLAAAIYSRAICVILTRRFLDHGRRSTVSFHLALAPRRLLWQSAFAAKVRDTVVCSAKRLLARQSMLIDRNDLAFLQEGR